MLLVCFENSALSVLYIYCPLLLEYFRYFKIFSVECFYMIMQASFCFLSDFSSTLFTRLYTYRGLIHFYSPILLPL
jgi:hypothetical protein